MQRYNFVLKKCSARKENFLTLSSYFWLIDMIPGSTVDKFSCFFTPLNKNFTLFSEIKINYETIYIGRLSEKKKKSWDVSSTFATAKMELFVALVNSF